jgi:hypothetical protein
MTIVSTNGSHSLTPNHWQGSDGGLGRAAALPPTSLCSVHEGTDHPCLLVALTLFSLSVQEAQ